MRWIGSGIYKIRLKHLLKAHINNISKWLRLPWLLILLHCLIFFNQRWSAGVLVLVHSCRMQDFSNGQLWHAYSPRPSGNFPRTVLQTGLFEPNAPYMLLSFYRCQICTTVPRPSLPILDPILSNPVLAYLFWRNQTDTVGIKTLERKQMGLGTDLPSCKQSGPHP